MFEVYSLVLFAHVVAAVALVGHSLSSPITRAALREAETLADVRRIVAFEGRISRGNPAIALVLLASGIYLGSAGWWTQGWFYLSVVGWVANAVLAGRVVGPWTGALMSAAAGEGRVPPPVDAIRRSTKLAVAAQVMLANDVALLFIMMNKPTALASVAVLAVANAVLVALALVPRRAASPVLTGAES